MNKIISSANYENLEKKEIVKYIKPSQNKKVQKNFQVHYFWCLFSTAGSLEKATENGAPLALLILKRL